MTNMLNRQNHNVNSTNAPPARRAGFSLVEILVVMGILGILIVLIVTAISPLLGGARVAATQTTIAQINDVIQARYEAVKNADVSVEAKKLAALNSALDAKDAEYLIRITLYRQALPQCPEDMFGLDLVDSSGGNDAPYAAMWNGPDSSDGSAVTAAEVFLFALTKGNAVRALPGGKSYPVPVLELDNINRKHIANSDNDTDTTGAPLNEIVDDWGQPLRFYNFPTALFPFSSSSFDVSDAKLLITGLPETDLSATGPIGQDPFDATGTHFQHLRDEFDTDPTTQMTFKTGGGTTSTPVAIINTDKYYHVNRYFIPLLVSAGPDQVLGLNEPTNDGGNSSNPKISAARLGVVTDRAAMTDNITNRQQ